MNYAVLALLLGVSAALSGCATNGAMLPVQTKAEARRYTYGEPVVVKADYLALARHWDENAVKPTGPMGGSRARLDVFEATQTAHIISGDGFIDGMIELKGQPDGSTVMTTYAWGGSYGTVVKWRDMIAAAAAM